MPQPPITYAEDCLRQRSMWDRVLREGGPDGTVRCDENALVGRDQRCVSVWSHKNVGTRGSQHLRDDYTDGQDLKEGP